MGSGAPPERVAFTSPRCPFAVALNRVGPLQHVSPRRRTRGRAPFMLTCRNLLPTALADTDATCSRRLTLRGEGTRRVTTIPEISPLAQSFVSAVRLQCSDLTQYLSNTYALSLCKRLIFSGWVSSRTISVAHFHVNINHRTALRALVATLLDAYSRIEALCCCTGLVFENMGMRPNSHENRSEL